MKCYCSKVLPLTFSIFSLTTRKGIFFSFNIYNEDSSVERSRHNTTKYCFFSIKKQKTNQKKKKTFGYEIKGKYLEYYFS